MKMKDLAKRVGLSRQTVSAVLNDKTWVSEKTRQKVLKAVNELQYTPNQHAVTLRGKASKLIGVVLRDISNPFYTQLALGVESVARANNYGILYYNTLENHTYEVEAIRSLTSYRVSGIIISPLAIGVDHSHLQSTIANETPLVSIDDIPDVHCLSVSFANEKASFEATSYLISMGHKKIAFIKGPKTASSGEDRLRGFLDCMEKNKLNVPPSYIISGDLSNDEAGKEIKMLISAKNAPPTAILCFSDMIALSVYKAAHDLKLKIPENISVVGFDDIEIASVLGPALTTMKLDSFIAGKKAAQMILDEIRGTDEPLKSIKLTPELIKRESVRELKKAKS